ncbi:hypothetical protein AMECASPLE_038717 [Ameca splendens]|uniref:Uncharacterized protein n=1 Tax=Ameca splendens TaxID=208324 RepID=A0ABV0Y8Y7_9TELE
MCCIFTPHRTSCFHASSHEQLHLRDFKQKTSRINLKESLVMFVSARVNLYVIATYWPCMGAPSFLRVVWTRGLYLGLQSHMWLIRPSTEIIADYSKSLDEVSRSQTLIIALCVLQLEEDELKGVPVLVFANKQDLPRAMSVSDITEALSLSGVQQPWFVQSSCAVSGAGLVEGLDWLSNQILKK